MWRGGNSQVGFEVSYDTARRILYLRMWGLWDEPLAVQYRDATLAAMKPLSPARPSFVLADLSRYPTQKPAVQKYHAELMGKSAAHGITRSANLVAGTLTSMQIRRLSQESGIAEFSFFQDEAKAVKWLLSGNEKSGFKITYDDKTRILTLRMWGLWTEELGLLFREAMNSARAPLRPPLESYVLADLRRYPTQKPEVQKIHAELMSKSESHGIKRSANLVTEVLASMQIRRLSHEGKLVEFSFFDNEPDAVEWLQSNARADEEALAKLARKRK
jgi:hypothetical protein